MTAQMTAASAKKKRVRNAAPANSSLSQPPVYLMVPIVHSANKMKLIRQLIR